MPIPLENPFFASQVCCGTGHAVHWRPLAHHSVHAASRTTVLSDLGFPLMPSAPVQPSHAEPMHDSPLPAAPHVQQDAQPSVAATHHPLPLGQVNWGSGKAPGLFSSHKLLVCHSPALPSTVPSASSLLSKLRQGSFWTFVAVSLPPWPHACKLSGQMCSVSISCVILPWTFSLTTSMSSCCFSAAPGLWGMPLLAPRATSTAS